MSAHLEVFSKAIIDHVEATLASLRQRADMHFSPRWEESKLIASLRLWEVVTENDANTNHTILCWMKYRKRAHPDHPEWMLSDTPALREMLSVITLKPSETSRAVGRVRRGIKRVYRRVRSSYDVPEKQSEGFWARGARLTEILVRHEAKSSPFIEDATALEASLLTLVEWLEWFLSCGKSRDMSVGFWRDEIRHSRKCGPPSTKTFSTDLPLESRLHASKMMPKDELRRAYGQLIRWMRRIFDELRVHLARRNKEPLSLNGHRRPHDRAALA